MQVIPVRTSERTCFKSCRQKWYWAYVENLKAKRTSVPLKFGDLIHIALAGHYKPGKKRGPHPTKIFNKIYGEWLAEGNDDLLVKKLKESEDEQVTRWKASELGPNMLNNYMDLYKGDTHLEVISPEQTFQVDVSNEDGVYLFTYVGTIDCVVRDLTNGRLGFLEHKTGGGLDPFGAPVALDEQTGAYWAFGPDWLRAKGYLKPGEELDFVIFNRLKKSFADTRPKDENGYALNQNGTISKRQPGPLFKREFVYRSAIDRQRVMARTRLEVREMKLVRLGKLGVYKNPDRHCGFCEFRDMCEVHESGSDWEAIRDQMFTKWEPYGDHADDLEED